MHIRAATLRTPQALVIKEHGVEALTEQLQNSQSEDVWQKCAGCLMVLVANSDKVKNFIGEQMGVKALTAIVKQGVILLPMSSLRARPSLLAGLVGYGALQIQTIETTNLLENAC